MLGGWIRCGDNCLEWDSRVCNQLSSHYDHYDTVQDVEGEFKCMLAAAMVVEAKSCVRSKGRVSIRRYTLFKQAPRRQ